MRNAIFVGKQSSVDYVYSNQTVQQLFQEMNSRGWYPVTKAEEQKLSQAKQQYATTVSK